MQRSGRANENATFAHPDYIRLFGMIPPEQAIRTVDPTSLRDDGNLGPPPVFSSDPKAAAGLFLSGDHPSARALADIAALRLRHVDNGHTPESDAAHGPVFFMSAARAWWERAKAARTADARRKAMVAAAAIFVAMIDAHDFTQQQEPTP